MYQTVYRSRNIIDEIVPKQNNYKCLNRNLTRKKMTSDLTNDSGAINLYFLTGYFQTNNSYLHLSYNTILLY